MALTLILVLEDEFLVAMELAALLEDCGFRVLGPASTVQSALRLLDQQHPDAAVLDLNLRNETVTPVAQVLRQMAVPFVIASAYAPSAWPRDDALNGVPRPGEAALARYAHCGYAGSSGSSRPRPLLGGSGEKWMELGPG